MKKIVLMTMCLFAIQANATKQKLTKNEYINFLETCSLEVLESQNHDCEDEANFLFNITDEKGNVLPFDQIRRIQTGVLLARIFNESPSDFYTIIKSISSEERKKLKNNIFETINIVEQSIKENCPGKDNYEYVDQNYCDQLLKSIDLKKSEIEKLFEED